MGKVNNRRARARRPHYHAAGLVLILVVGLVATLLPTHAVRRLIENPSKLPKPENVRIHIREMGEMRSMPNLSYISPKAAVKNSAIHRRGLFATEPIREGEIVCVKGGHVFNRETLDQVAQSLGPAEIQIAEKLFIGPLSEEEREGSMIFSNHSCEPNIGVKGQIVFVAMRDIDAGEELAHDWATTDDDDYEIECKCGAPSCRRIITGQDWRRKDLQEKYAGYMSWYLTEKIRGPRA